MRHLAPLMMVLSIACSSSPVVIVEDVGFTITVEPETVQIVTGTAGGEPVQFVATAHFEDGSTQGVDIVEWTVSNRSAGSIDQTGLFTPALTNGGVTWVTAGLSGESGTATATVVFRDSVYAADVDSTLFFGAEVPIADSWAYPENGVNLPRNTPSIHFQWQNLGAEAYRLRFRSDITDVSVYTVENQWVADEATWETLASTNAGGEVRVGLSAAASGEVLVEPDITLNVNRMDARGSIIYWTTSKSGLVEIPYGGAAVDFYTSTQAGTCVGCHAISNDGKIAYSLGGGDGALAVRDLATGDEPINSGSGHRGNFKSFSPDGELIVATASGTIHLHNANTGAYLGVVYSGNDATHVDWSPDGSLVAFTKTDGHSADWVCGSAGWSSDIMVMDHLGDGVFAEPRLLVDPGPGLQGYYPAFSPDGEWVAFNVSTGDCYDDLDATLMVIDTAGTLEPIRLNLANQGNNLTNSWPRWGPLPDDDVLWLTFASRRNYGFQTVGMPQIWVSAFDPAKAREGEDPTWPAFWLPGQELTTANHIPMWVEL